ncbi:MAG: PQQ-binding-like beta-propeller repeat protein [Verrucomicrobiae bacterium]|nr:PQQ-binding-like beta-propeller repeat protein [Verrucomicrobiae bacterium]
MGACFSRNMVSAEMGLPAAFDLDTGQNVLWTGRLGSESHATPVVANGRILMGTNNEAPRNEHRDGDRGVLMCFDEESGAFQWQLVVPKITTSRFWDWPRAGLCSTPAVEGDRVYVVSNRGEVMCLDLAGLANGNDGAFQDEARHATPADEPVLPLADTDADILWLFDMIQELNVRQHDSAHACILIDGPFLYVNTSNGVDDTHKEIHSPDAPSLIVVEKATGRLVAVDRERIGPRIFHSTWSSPMLAEVDGQRRIFFAGGDGVIYAFEALKEIPPPGEVLGLRRVWSFDLDPTGPKENVQQYNSNRKVSPTNVKSIPVFHDGRVYVTGGGDLWWGKNESWLWCLNPSGSGDATTTGMVWRYRLGNHVMASPAVADGLVFAADCDGTLHCVDAATGEACWTFEANGAFWASPFVADGKVYCATQRGWAYVFELGREQKQLHSVKLDGPVSATPVAANGRLYLATMRNLFALALATGQGE